MTNVRKNTSSFFDREMPGVEPHGKKTKRGEVVINHFDVKFKQYQANSGRAALLIHGGCFMKGDETWNSGQANSIAKKCGLDIFTLDFSKSSFKESINDIKIFFTKLYTLYSGNVGLIGCSSGGFLVLNVLKEINEPQFVVLICPVMDPEARENMLLNAKKSLHNRNIQKNQLDYFKSRPYPKAESVGSVLDIIIAKKDENVPSSLIATEAKRHGQAKLHFIEGDHTKSYKASAEVNEIIIAAMKNTNALFDQDRQSKKVKF